MAAPGPSRAVPFPGTSLCALEDHCALPPDMQDLPLAIVMAGTHPSSQEIPTALVSILVLCHAQLSQH